MDFVRFGIYIYLLASINITDSLTFTTENVHGGKWITTDGATEILICRNNPFTGIMVLEYENRLVAECIVNSCQTYFTDYGAFEIQSDMRSGVLKWKIGPITIEYNSKVFKCSDGLETLRLSPIIKRYEGSLTFKTDNVHGGKWMTKNGATDILICKNKPYTGKMALIYENQGVAKCTLNSCKTYFTAYGTFDIEFDIKNGVTKWKISPITKKYNGKLFKCSNGIETLRLSPVVQESLTFTTENFHGGKWIIKNGETDTLICRNNPYTGEMSLIYEQQRVAECLLKSCKTYFTDYGTFSIQFDMRNGVIKWIINPVRMKYNGKLFQCSDGTETLSFSPVVEDNFISGIPLLLYAFSLALSIFIYAILLIRSADRPGTHEDLNNGWSTMVSRLKTVAEGKLSVQLAMPRPTRAKQIIKNDLTLVKLIGKGSFGEVWKGVWRNCGKDKNVALKMFTTGGKEEAEANIEVELMQLMDHENIIQFHGTCIRYNYIVIIVMEFIENGNLLQYIQDERRNIKTAAFVDIGSQIVNGLIYLESLLIIHRDLAARNILVDSFSNGNTIRTVKIADFGLARRIEDENSEYIPKRQEPFPLRWTAPEAIEYKIFTFKSDVWSFGILLMEMVMFGLFPYAGKKDEEILPYLKQSPENRMECPNHCHPDLYKIMQMCWKLNRAKRPTFQELKENLEKFS